MHYSELLKKEVLNNFIFSTVEKSFFQKALSHF